MGTGKCAKLAGALSEDQTAAFPRWARILAAQPMRGGFAPPGRRHRGKRMIAANAGNRLAGRRIKEGMDYVPPKGGPC